MRPGHTVLLFKRRRHALLSRVAAVALLALLAVVLSPLLVSAAAAQRAVPAPGSLPLTTLIGLAALAFIPFVFLATTSFVKLSIVFSILRNALGTGQVPSSMIITALAAILTFYVMAPTGSEMAAASAAARVRIDTRDPLAGDSAQAVIQTIESGKEPLRRFLKRNAGEREIELFVRLARRKLPPDKQKEVTADDFMIALSAFLITELKEAFQIGFLVFIPFLVIDMVVANILLSLGMHMLSPTTISLPFKLLLFVLVDGFYLLTQALLLGYQ